MTGLTCRGRAFRPGVLGSSTMERRCPGVTLALMVRSHVRRFLPEQCGEEHVHVPSCSRTTPFVHSKPLWPQTGSKAARSPSRRRPPFRSLRPCDGEAAGLSTLQRAPALTALAAAGVPAARSLERPAHRHGRKYEAFGRHGGRSGEVLGSVMNWLFNGFES